MRTITLKQNIIETLDSDEKKLEFANSVIGLLSDSKTTTDSSIDEVLINGLNTDIPKPMEGAPDFDSDNMSASEFKRYSMVSAGYVPAGGNGVIGSLDCGYSAYKYKQLTTLSRVEIDSLWHAAIEKLKQNWKKRSYAKFLSYLCDIYYWYYANILLPSEKREDIDT